VATALGMLVAAVAKTSKQADDVGNVLAFVLAGVGGAIPLAGTPLAREGGLIGAIAKLTPHAYAVEGYYHLMAENGTLVQILPQLGILAAMALVFSAIATSRFKFQ
jgi:ABC-2 type transport system permease protein